MSPPAVRQVSEDQTGAPLTGESSHVRRPDVRLGCALTERRLPVGQVFWRRTGSGTDCRICGRCLAPVNHAASHATVRPDPETGFIWHHCVYYAAEDLWPHAKDEMVPGH